MKNLFRVAALLMFCSTAPAAESRSCAGAVSLQDFRLLAASPGKDRTLPLPGVNALRAGDRLIYRPSRRPPNAETKGRIAVVLVPSADEPAAELTVLEAHRADEPAEWKVPFRVGIVAVAFGPQGLDVKKVDSLVAGKERLIAQLADYAEQTARVGALVETLSSWEQASSRQTGLDAVLSGFSSQYGVAIPKLNPANPADQQAALLLRALLPPLSSYDPLSAQPATRVQQSAGLAATVASLFLGSPVALAAGGTALFQNLRALLFPDTDFRSAFAQSKAEGEMALCSEPRPGKSRTRPAYLWAVRLPACGPPALSLGGDLHLPTGWRSPVRVKARDAGAPRLLSRVQGWQLAPVTGGAARIVKVAAGPSSNELLLDLTEASFEPGAYRLVGRWDWDTFELPGTLQLHPFGNLSAAHLTPASEDRLVEGSERVAIRFEGTDFEFVEKVSLVKTDARGAAPADLFFSLPRGKGEGPQEDLQTEIDTAGMRPGAYGLRITQLNGQSHELKMAIHPPDPTLVNVPLRVNLGETRQRIRLRGTGLDRIERITGPGMSWELEPVASAPGSRGADEREAAVTLQEETRQGERLEILLAVAGKHEPLRIPAALEVAGPRPRIVSAERSSASAPLVELRAGELPVGFMVNFALRTENLQWPGILELSCGRNGVAQPPLVLRTGGTREAAKLDFAGDGVLFLSIEPGILGSAGCDLTAVAAAESTGRSDPFLLGRVVQVPQVEKFEWTDERVGDSLFVGILTGKDLHTIEKAGWDGQHGYAVAGLPKPDSADPQRQTLRIALPWPSPAPRSPIFLWLRGEKEGRAVRLSRTLEFPGPPM